MDAMATVRYVALPAASVHLFGIDIYVVEGRGIIFPSEHKLTFTYTQLNSNFDAIDM